MHIFFSHSSRDRDLAASLKRLLLDLFGAGRLTIDFSSDQEAGGGIPPGEQWLPWIRERIEQARQTYVLLTPNSVTKPWVLWEAGASAGVALALNRDAPVVPITFGIDSDDIPGPFSASHYVAGDDPRGVERLLQAVNDDLGRPLTESVFREVVRPRIPVFLDQVTAVLAQSAPLRTLLSSVPGSFPAGKLAGLWATSYQLGRRSPRCHADIALVTPESDRRVRIRNHPPEPRTDGRTFGFRNEIEAELVTRHLIGHWKNLSDERYFGGFQLAVLPGENVMEGEFTSLESDIKVGVGRWRWVRLERSLTAEQLERLTLREPRLINTIIKNHEPGAGRLELSAVVEEA